LIADINKKIAEEKKLNGPEQKVVKISLPQIDPKVHFDFDSREKEDIYDELRSSLKEQLPEWWSQEKVVCIVHSNEYYPDVGSWQQKPSHKQWRFPFIYNCPPPQIWIEVVYNITNDRERALEKIWSSKCYCCKTKFIIIVLPYGKEPYHQNPSPGSDSEEVEDDDDYENPKPCPYCGEIIPNSKGMVRHIKENCQHDFY
ncbi:hypothetical protein RhiirB3_433482, partial [Rhizophagus irregularis]